MANRPGALCSMQKGLAIGAQNNFADTFNWIVACLKNLKAGKNCKINWPASDTPEIECSVDPPTTEEYAAAFQGSLFHFGYLDGYVQGGAVQIGGKTIFVDGAYVEAQNGFICVKVDLQTSYGSNAEITTYGSEQELGSAQDDMRYYIFPLYKIQNCAIVVDYRPMPNAGCWELQ